MIQQGKKIPEDISVYGFQNTKYASLSRPKLSCVELPIEAIGVHAMSLLKQEIDGEHIEVKFNVLPHSIITRQTTR